MLCQHSHCIGTVEKHLNGIILYGQGNSIYGYQPGKPGWNEGLAVFVDLDTRVVAFRLLAAKADGVCFAERGESEKRITRMLEDSTIVNDAEEMKTRWVQFCQQQAALDLPLLYGKNRVYTKVNRILRNQLVNRLISRKKQMITMNLIRCESHQEVIQTILENTIFN